MSNENESLLRLVNASGFLFQLKVEQEIERLKKPYGSNWSVVSREHRWIDPISNKEYFIDLILKSDAGRMIIECKRVKEGIWAFLIPNSKTDMSRARLLWTHLGKTSKPCSEWDEFKFSHSSPESAFCVIRGKGEGETSMLERLSGMVLRSIEFIAEQELQMDLPREYGPAWIYLPAIVTNAELKVCVFDPDTVDIETGTIPNAKFNTVPFIRFRKSLSTTYQLDHQDGSINKSYELQQRTVFIINSKNLDLFLPHAEVKPFFSNEWPWDKVLGNQ